MQTYTTGPLLPQVRLIDESKMVIDLCQERPKPNPSSVWNYTKCYINRLELKQNYKPRA